MIYTDQTRLAMKICFQAHQHQTDKSGVPYVFHPIHLAEQMQTEETVLAALLHDVIEDTPYTPERLEQEGIPSEVIRALTLLTHDKNEPYLEYVCRIGCNSIAKAVKIADLTHNSDLTRMVQITDTDRLRVRKYRTAKTLLQNIHPVENHYETFYPISSSVMLFISATEQRVLSCGIQTESWRYTLSMESVYRLNDLIGDSQTSFTENLEQFCKNHTISELETFIRTVVC